MKFRPLERAKFAIERSLVRGPVDRVALAALPILCISAATVATASLMPSGGRSSGFPDGEARSRVHARGPEDSRYEHRFRFVLYAT